MSVFTGANAVEDGLVLSVDAANIRSYDRYENLIINSESINSWANNGNAISITANAATAPDGTLTADTLAQTAVTGAGRWVSSTTLTYTAGVTYTLSIWLKKISGTDTQPSIALWVNTGTNQSVGTITTEWVRYFASFTPVSTISSNTFTGLDIGWNTNGVANNFVFAAWGFQVERSATASEYYATTSTAKNRGTTWSDISVSAASSTLTSTTYSSTNSGSIVFDGSASYASISNLFSGGVSIPFSFGGWFSVDSYSQDNGLISILNSGSTSSYFALRTAITTGYPTLSRRNTTDYPLTASVAPGTNTPFHIFANVNSTTSAEIYLNGELITKSTSLTAVSSSSTIDDVLIGLLRTSSPTWYLNGNCYGVQIYNQALTSDEIKNNYHAQRGRFQDRTVDTIVYDGLIVNLDAGDPYSYSGTGTIWRDLSGNGYNADIYNGVLFDSTNGGRFSFDGSNDYMKINSTITGIKSIIMVFTANPPDTNWRYLFDSRPNGSWLARTTLWNTGNWSTNYVNTGPIDITDIPTGTLCCLYTEHTTSHNSTINIFSRFSNNEFMLGDLYCFLVYNKNLSIQEIAQNFNALRRRYGI